jgi:thioredoxin reductase
MNMERADVAVVGAGPAGLCAAIEAARAGLDVVIIDENPKLGGQIFRRLPEEFSATGESFLNKELARGEALLAELAGLPVRWLSDTLVWGVFEDRVLELAGNGKSRRLKAKALVIAAGAYDRPVPLPGWTLPGVLTIGGAQTLLKSQRMLPGKRILLAGTGPLQLVVARQLVSAGADIAAVVEAVPTRALFPYLGTLLKTWSITREGLGHRWILFRSHVPWIAPAVLVRIEGKQEVERAVIARADVDSRPIPGTEKTIEVDTVCMGYGLIPSVELPRLFGCAVRYDTTTDVWVPERNEDFETNVPGIFVVGDGAGVAGAVVAAEEGRIAGITVARRLNASGGRDADEREQRARRRLGQLARFRSAMDAIYRPRPGLHELATEETFLCRCEEVRRSDLESAVEDGAESLDSLKAWTRAGMGPCQSRMCGLPVAHFLSRRTKVSMEEIGRHTPRPPVKPVPIDTLIQNEE